MPSRRTITRWLVAAFLVTGWPAQYASATTSPIRVVVSFSILKDIVQEVGGTQVVVSSLIGPDSDAHVFEPSPDHARLPGGQLPRRAEPRAVGHKHGLGEFGEKRAEPIDDATRRRPLQKVKSFQPALL